MSADRLLVTNAVIAPESTALSAILIDKGDFAAVVPMAELVAPLLPHPWLELRGALGPRNFAERS